MTENISIKDIVDIKDALLAKKQGEALERITKPSLHEEGLGLGYFDSDTVLALAALDLWETIINEITGLTDYSLHQFTQTNNNSISIQWGILAGCL